MSSFPSTPGFVTTNVDQGTDSPASARGDIKNLMDDVSDIITTQNSSDGTCVLNSEGFVGADQLGFCVPANVVEYTAAGNYSWPVPAGVERIKVYAVGAGGGGGWSNVVNGAPTPGWQGDHGGGGGGGGVAVKYWSVTPGDTVTISVGAGGTGGQPGASDDDGSDGADTTVTIDGTTITGHGGTGGAGNASGGFEGDGGSASNGDLNLRGGDGNGGTTRGGRGGGNAFSGGASGGSGNLYGAGGTGGGAPFGAGGDGAPGAVVIEY